MFSNGYTDCVRPSFQWTSAFTSVGKGKTVGRPITLSLQDKSNILSAHNFLREQVIPKAANMKIMVIHIY